MENPYVTLAQKYAKLFAEGRTFPCGGFEKLPMPPADGPTVLWFAPHPDDECISGGWALRLRKEGCNVIDVAVTLGSNKARQLGREAELKTACEYMNFGLEVSVPGVGLEHVTKKEREANPEEWQKKVDVIKGIIEKYQPAIIGVPHAGDWNGTHIGTHYVVEDAVRQLNYKCTFVETEFWGAMDKPNLMCELQPEDVGALMTGISFHIGEVSRNPYHLSLPGWMIDNVRRGGEIVGGQGGAVPDFTFAAIYYATKFENGEFKPFYEKGKMLSSEESLKDLLLK